MPHRFTRVLAGLLTLPLLAVAGCGEPPAETRSTPGVAVGPGGVDPAALDRWAAFPVDRTPRPIVLLGDSPVGPDGFANGDAKTAALDGRFVLAADLPEVPDTVRVALPDGAVEARTITARQAFDRLAAPGDARSAPDSSPPPLRVTRVELGSAEFGTDRGPLRLPAWRFRSPEMTGVLAVPALAEETFWRPAGGIGPVYGAAELAADGVTLTVSVPEGRGGCPGEPTRLYTPEVAESDVVVAVVMRVTEIPSTTPPGPLPCAHDLMARPGELRQVRLGRPLGARILVGSDGSLMVARRPA